MNFYGLLHENLLPQKFKGDITVSNILLPEIANHLLIRHAKSRGGTDDSKMIVVIVITQPYQNERLKVYNTLLDMLFISFITESNLQKRGI